MQKAGWLLCCGLLAGHLQGATLFVTSTLDFDPALPGTLRQAILDANGALGDDTIQILAVGTIGLVTNLPAITDNTSIVGPGTNLLTVSASNQFGVFAMNGGTTNTLSGLTIADGSVTNFSYPVVEGGAGISNAGSLKLLNCSVSNCTVGAPQGQGGGIYNMGDLLMQNCEVSSCSALNQGGPSGAGGGIANRGDLGMGDCIVSACVAGNEGGGIYSTSNLFLTNCTIESCAGGVIEGAGGGIGGGGNLTVHSCTISNCAGFGGGGMWWSGTAAITNSTITENSCTGVDGGGGLHLGGTIIIVGCTIAGNSSDLGGGIYNDGEMTLLNCTVSGNEFGGGIANGGQFWGDHGTNATIYANHCTVAFNADGGVEGAGVVNAGFFHAQDSMFAGNVAWDGTIIDFSGVLISEGHNLIQSTNGCTITNSQPTDIYGVDPLLGPLQDNGGPTWTCALLPGSPAIDQGTSGGLTTDQRGMPRPYDVPGIPNVASGDGSDIGAFEWTPPHSAFLITPNGAPTAGSPYALTITAVDQYQKTATFVTGDHSFTFAGLAVADDGTYPTITDKNGNPVNLGTPTTITFTNGVNSAGGSLRAYKAQTATLTASDATSGKTTSNTGGTSVNLAIGNVSPLGGAHNLVTTVSVPLVLSISTLANMDYDANHDTLTIIAVGSTRASASGTSVALDTGAGTITYTPGAYVGADQFRYMIADPFGATATSIANVTVRLGKATSAFNSISLPVGGIVNLRGYGIPGNKYDVQRSTDNMVTWNPLATVTVPGNGIILYTDNPGSDTTAFYRFAVH